jgi:hypothetical protein
MEKVSVLTKGTRIKRVSDGVEGVIVRFFRAFGTIKKSYNSYLVRWDDGKTGIPNEDDFRVIN